MEKTLPPWKKKGTDGGQQQRTDMFKREGVFARSKLKKADTCHPVLQARHKGPGKTSAPDGKTPWRNCELPMGPGKTLPPSPKPSVFSKKYQHPRLLSESRSTNQENVLKGSQKKRINVLPTPLQQGLNLTRHTPFQRASFWGLSRDDYHQVEPLPSMITSGRLGYYSQL